MTAVLLLLLQAHVNAVGVGIDHTSYVQALPSVSASTAHAYAKDCGKRYPSLLQKAKLPGAGMDPVSITPYDVVLKDGYMHVGCFKDKMHEYGDKFGNNKFSYNLEESANVSIIRYKEMVLTDKQEPLTHTVCFKFCRTIPLMGFFGVTHGRDCYCMPYYEQMAGDSSDCDSVCEGDAGSFCGGETKSSIFSMYMCSDTAMELTAVADTSKAVSTNLTNSGTDAMNLAKSMETLAVKNQGTFGKAGDPTASQLMQSTKVFSGKVLHAAEDSLAAAQKLDAGVLQAEKMAKADFKDNTKITAAEKVIASLEAAATDGTKKLAMLDDLYGLATRGKKGKGRIDEYYPLMYFVDKTYNDVPTTCGGDADEHTVFAQSKGQCAAACDAQVKNCVGFSFYDGGLCFLFSKFKSVTYYTKCGNVTTDKTKTACYAKLEDFEGVSLKPDPSGKCALCLTKATQAKRCF